MQLRRYLIIMIARISGELLSVGFRFRQVSIGDEALSCTIYKFQFRTIQ